MAVNRYPWTSAVIVAPLAMAYGADCRASVTRAEPQNGVLTSDFSGVGLFGRSGSSSICSAVAILDGRHILTTRHCVTTTGVIAGPTHDPSAFWFQAEGVTYQGEDLFADFDADLALLRLDGVVPGAFDLWGPEDGSEIGRIFTGVGFGATDADGNGQWGPGGQGVKRLFENTIDAITVGSISGQGSVLRYDFDLFSGDPVGELEGLHGPGDSGAGAFLYDPLSDDWLLAGIMSSAGAPVNGATGSIVQIAAHREAIFTAIPEPSTALLLGLPMLGLFHRRR